MLKIKNLSLSIDKKEILKDISLEFLPNSQTTILGPNGSGKSSLIKCIIGINDMWSGSIELNGVDIRELTYLERAKIISYVPQFLEVHADYSVWDFMEMSYYPHLEDMRTLNDFEIEKADSILNDFNLLDFKHRSLLSLSGGERQRVFIAASIFQSPKILLLDEPTSFLDPKIQDEINKIIFSLEKRMSVVLVSHDINSSILNSKRIIALKKGERFYDGSAVEFISKKYLDELFEKSFTLVNHPEEKMKMIVPEIYKS